MLFNSLEFIFGLLPLSVIGYFLFGKYSTRVTVLWLVAVSFAFYAWWRVGNLPVCAGSTLGNYLLGRMLNRADGYSRRWRRVTMLGGVALNLAVLGFFKYSAFAATNLNAAFSLGLPVPDLVLPLGISFFTFTQITYLVDAFKRPHPPHPLPVYALFVSYFPHLLAGPILHHEEMLPQFTEEKNKVPHAGNILRGLCLFGVGLSKKVLLADALAPFAHAGFDSTHHLAFAESWTTALAYGFQIYFDFSGYTDMAIGASLLFNIRLPLNFDSPYRSGDIQEFWRRWHITLGRFFRDYIYIPIGGNRLGHRRTLVNLFSVALLSGLWHGAGWTFIVWGALHGLAIVVRSTWKNAALTLPRPAGWLLTFVFVNVAWVFFRAPSVSRAVEILRSMAGLNGTEPFAPSSLVETGAVLAYLATAGTLAFWPRNSNALLDPCRAVPLPLACAIAVLAALSVVQLNQLSEFIYFNF